MPGLVRALDQAGIGLKGLTLAQPTLDDVFLRVTGERLPPTEAGGGRGMSDILLLIGRALKTTCACRRR